MSITGGFIILFDLNSFLMKIGFSDFFALMAGIFFACTNVLARKFSKIHYQSKSFAIWIGVAVGGTFLILITNDLNVTNLINSNSLILLFIIGLLLFCSTLIIQYGLPKINPVKASPIFTFEIIVAALSSYWLASEILAIKDLVGGLFIILAISLSALK
jgi:drug/metabolite transporter (DMT)-like permease